MKQALRRNPARRKTAVDRSLPAPVGGWDAENSLADMPVENASILDNWIPRAGYVETRQGSIAHATGFLAPVESLLVYRGATNDRLFACAGAGLFDATAAGAVGAAMISGLSNARWQGVNFSNDAGRFLLAVNGLDDPRRFDGTTWTAPTFTYAGPVAFDPKRWVDVMAHKRRLFFAERDSLRVWFLDANAVAGNTRLLDLGPIFPNGGSLLALDTWTLDGGNGPDDYAVFLTDQGEVAVYAGIDPASATDWSLVGVFQLSLPLGRRSLVKLGAELVILTASGVIPLTKALDASRAEDSDISITRRIKNAFATAAQAQSGTFGWQGVVYPRGGLAIFNVPVSSGGTYVQYVQNVQTGAWCRFTGLNARCWAMADDQPFFGGENAVWRWDVGGRDGTSAIAYDLKSAFTDFRFKSIKRFTMIRPILRASVVSQPALDVLTDYREATPTAVPTVGGTGEGLWGAGVWGSAAWSNPDAIRADWSSASGYGYVGAARMRMSYNRNAAPGVQLIGFDFKFEVGDGL